MDPQLYHTEGIEEIKVVSSLDGSEEPSLFLECKQDGPRPLFVGLHTWSYDRHNQVDAMLPLARKHGWHLLLPEFRGPNLVTNPRAREACASRLAMQDVIDAVEYVCPNYAVDRAAVMLAGASGGGHMAMMMAGYRPALWRTVAAFVGISDLAAWHREKKEKGSKHADNMEACCGGAPSGAVLEEYRKRSPIHYAEQIARAELFIYHGKYDRSVDFSQSVRLFEDVNRVNPDSRVFLQVFDGAHQMPMDMVEAQFLGALAREQQGTEVTG